ncbi:LysR family transcriptional regulator [Thermus tenuipuniceus]|uniref:LysR family transcriptional regulator n=1 Tax=Thermus tenuipuniceus TaxID=2078690 RepID=UPI000CFA3102|nr:LysR family transcriptional regulator [Thermus tenuipuniceus]
MNLRRLRLFLLLAEERNFHRAAEKAYLSQPALSQQIQALEQELGVKLLERRPFRLTPAGEVLVREGRQLLQEVEALKARVRCANRGQPGKGYLEELRFGVPENLLPDLMPLLDHLRRGLGQPVEILEMHTPEQVKALKEGQLDYGLAGLRVEDPAIGQEPLLRVPIVVALPEEHPLASRERVPLKALEGEPFLLLPKEILPPLYEAFMEVFRRAGFTPRVAREVARFSQAVSLVAAGVGVYLTLAPYRVFPHPGVVLKPLEEEAALQVSLIYRLTPPPPRLLEVRELLKALVF